MTTTYPMPKWGVTMEDGTITEWRVKPGDTVKEGDVIGAVETEKIDVEFESPSGGVIAGLLAEEGETVDCGADVLVLADDEDDYKRYLTDQS